MVIESGIEGHVTFMTPAHVQRRMANAPGIIGKDCKAASGSLALLSKEVYGPPYEISKS